MEWLSYRPEDFIPFTADAYLNLITRASETYWPLPILLWMMAVGSVLLQFHRKRMWSALSTALLSGLLWIVSGFIFFHQFYRELVWVATEFSLAFYVQGLLLSLCLFMGESDPGKNRPATLLGILLCATSLAWPLLSGWRSGHWQQAEWVGLHPDPTAVLGIGLALLSMNGWRRWICCLIPTLWLSISLITQRTIGLLNFL